MTVTRDMITIIETLVIMTSTGKTLETTAIIKGILGTVITTKGTLDIDIMKNWNLGTEPR